MKELKMYRLMLLLFAVCLICGCQQSSDRETAVSDGEATPFIEARNETVVSRPAEGNDQPTGVTSTQTDKVAMADNVTNADPETQEDESIEERIAKAVDESQFNWRDGLVYLANSETPYTGWGKEVTDGRVRGLSEYKDGMLNGPSVSWHQNGQKASEISLRNNRPGPGPHNSWYENGQKKSEAVIVGLDGSSIKFDGTFTQWYENGHKQSETHYDDGTADGTSTRWYESGARRSEQTYKLGVQVGTDTEWYEDGQKRRETEYKDGKKNGTEIWWHANGNKSSEAVFEDGTMVGNKLSWEKDGQPVVVDEEAWQTNPDIAELVRLIEAKGDSIQERLADAVDASQLQSRDRFLHLVDSDMPYTGWSKRYEKGFLTLKHWSNGRGNGLELRWFANGQKQMEASWSDGKMEGPLTMWDENGQKLQEVTAKNGGWDGVETKWHPNGQKKSETTYKDGKRIGKQIRWDEDGNVISK